MTDLRVVNAQISWTKGNVCTSGVSPLGVGVFCGLLHQVGTSWLALLQRLGESTHVLRMGWGYIQAHGLRAVRRNAHLPAAVRRRK